MKRYYSLYFRPLGSRSRWFRYGSYPIGSVEAAAQQYQNILLATVGHPAVEASIRRIPKGAPDRLSPLECTIASEALKELLAKGRGAI